MKYISAYLDRITMYRVVLYVLLAWTGIAAALSLFSVLGSTFTELLISLSAIIIASLFTHYTYAYLSGAPANVESTLITALILFFIFSPAIDLMELLTLAIIAIIAIASKYIFVWRKLHIMNPVVVAAVLASIIGLNFATWWIGNSAMFIVVLIGGVLIVSKIRRWPLVLWTITAAFGSFILLSTAQDSLGTEDIIAFFTTSAIIFFATVMVTEPLSTPAGTRNHILYGILVGGLSSLSYKIGPFALSNEMALLIGNLVFYPFSLRGRLLLTVTSIKQVARDTYEFAFTTSQPFLYKAGQYLEWTIPHRADTRGIRRYFTIASAPSETPLKLGVKITQQRSSFKDQMINLKLGDVIYATSLDGDFILPKNTGKQPLVFIAGGIGVTPFRSMVRELIDTKTKADVTLFYAAQTPEDIAYTDLWHEAMQKINLNLIPIISRADTTWQGETGYMSGDILRRNVHEIHKARYYISGPPPMVDACKKVLRENKVLNDNIITDYFPGLA